MPSEWITVIGLPGTLQERFSEETEAERKVRMFYRCGTFDFEGRCASCAHKISDLNLGRAMCPFNAYPNRNETSD